MTAGLVTAGLVTAGLVTAGRGDDQSGSSPISVSCVASSATATLRRWEDPAQDVERLTGGEVPAFHEDALGLPDDVAGAERGARPLPVG